LGSPRASLCVQLVDGHECRALNRRFRGKDRSTDVLSFPAAEGRPPQGFSGYLGDLALCLPYAWRKRGRFDPDFGGEAALLLLHGLLHLHGRHHDNAAQEAALWRVQRRLHPLWKGHAAALRRLAPIVKA
jgi:probable rRNA maturation factor